MQSRKRKKKKEISLGHILLMIGIVLSLLSGAVTLQSDKLNLQRILNESFDTITYHIVRFHNYEVADRTKSEVRLLDKAKELSRCLGHGEALQPLLEEYAYEQRLDGILITNQNNKPCCMWGDISTGIWDEFINNDASYAASLDPKNSYATRMKLGEQTYDFAIVSRQDKAGCVAVVSHKEEIAMKDEICLETLLDDQIFGLNGMVSIVSHDQIVGTNVEELKGKMVQEEFNIKEKKDTHEGREPITHLQWKGKHMCGSIRRVEGYDVYVFFPEKNVYKTVIITQCFGAFLYVMVCHLFLYLRYQQEQRDREKNAEQLRTIRSISRIYTFALLIDVSTDCWKTVKSVDYLGNIAGHGCNVSMMLRNYAYLVLDVSEQEAFLQFSNVKDMDERIAGNTYICTIMQTQTGKWNQLMFVPQKYDHEGKLQEVLFVCRDVTADKMRELQYQNSLRKSVEDAERASIAKTDFLRRMSHDIRTPINGIKGMIEISRYYADDETKQEECRRKIMSATSFLLDLVNNVLDMNKLESGEVRLEKKQFHLLDLLRETISLVEMQAVERNVSFQMEVCEGEHWDVMGSPVHLRQVLQNIISNAIKYNRAGGSVSVRVQEIASTEQTATFEFVCQDTGIGMSEEFQKRAFEPFAQEDASARTSYAGTGLGLAIAKELTEKMGGSIHFVSELGKGTTFTIQFCFQKAERVEEIEIIGNENLRLDGVNLLLVEDNDLNMEIAEFILENAGAHVKKAWNGKEAVDCFMEAEEGAYDVILMDIMMPIMDGLEATRHIRSLERKDAKKIPIFAMTANAFSDDKERSLQAGMNEHVSKPIEEKQLIRYIRKYMINHKASM